MQYDEAITNLLSLFDAERARADGPRQKVIYDLGRMTEFLDRIGNPHRRVPAVHIAGTKGKGSTAALCDAVFHAAGLRAGFYSSPHLHTFRERVRLDSQPVSQERFAALVTELWPLRQPEAPAEGDTAPEPVTMFEFLTGMAFYCYDQAGADVQTVEVGLGGRLDATNVVDAGVCVITSVSMDHAKILGDTIGEIAGEKAGILKPGAIPIIAPQCPEAMTSILNVCDRLGLEPALIGRDVTWEAKPAPRPNPDLERPYQSLTVHGLLGSYDLDLPLLGDYQLENAAAAVAAVESISRAQGFDISADTIARGFRDVSWPCRMELVGQDPVVIVDGAHNDYSVDKLLASLPHYFDYDRLVLIAGFSADKEVAAMAKSLAPAVGPVFATQARHPRAMNAEDLADLFRELGADAAVANTPQDALAQARAAAGPRDLVLATGSLFMAAEVREAALGLEPEIYALGRRKFRREKKAA